MIEASDLPTQICEDPLRKAGAASVTGVALGKFGKQLRYYQIDVKTDPYAPVVNGGFSIAASSWFTGKNSTATQQTLQKLIP